VTGSPVSFDATAVAPTDGHAITVVNVDHTQGELNLPGAGTCGRIGQVTGVAPAADGRVFFLDKFGNVVKIRVLDPLGDVATIAGGGESAVDGVPALDAKITVGEDVLFDEANNRMFVTGSYGGVSRVLRINLNQDPDFLYLYAGQGTIKPLDGDGGLATESHILAAGDLSMDPTNPDALYVVDAGHDRIRRIEGLVIENFYGKDDGDCAMDAVAIQDCAKCNVAWDDVGNAYVSGDICGVDPDGNTPGIVKLTLDVDDDVITIDHIAGANMGTQDWDGSPATSARFQSPGGVFWSAGALYVADDTGNKVGRIDLTTGIITAVMGDGSAGGAGDYGPATSALLNGPRRIDGRPTGDLVIADANNAAIRMVWNTL
jgi:hypothetical protein